MTVLNHTETREGCYACDKTMGWTAWIKHERQQKIRVMGDMDEWFNEGRNFMKLPVGKESQRKGDGTGIKRHS